VGTILRFFEAICPRDIDVGPSNKPFWLTVAGVGRIFWKMAWVLRPWNDVVFAFTMRRWWGCVLVPGIGIILEVLILVYRKRPHHSS
jgi:hypothetical protein